MMSQPNISSFDVLNMVDLIIVNADLDQHLCDALRVTNVSLHGARGGT